MAPSMAPPRANSGGVPRVFTKVTRPAARRAADLVTRELEASLAARIQPLCFLSVGCRAARGARVPALLSSPAQLQSTESAPLSPACQPAPLSPTCRLAARMPASPLPDCPRNANERRAATATAAQPPAQPSAQPQVSAAARQQLQDKARSLLRGLEHVQSCRAGAACGSALCHSTKRLLRTYATHECARAPDCRVCRLWQFLMAERARTKAAAAQDAPRDQAPLLRIGAACGSAALARRLSTRAAPSAIRRRVLVAAREAASSRRI